MSITVAVRRSRWLVAGVDAQAAPGRRAPELSDSTRPRAELALSSTRRRNGARILEAATRNADELRARSVAQSFEPVTSTSASGESVRSSGARSLLSRDQGLEQEGRVELLRELPA